MDHRKSTSERAKRIKIRCNLLLSLLSIRITLSLTNSNCRPEGEKGDDSKDNGHPDPWLTSRTSLKGSHKYCMQPFRGGKNKQDLYGSSGPGLSDEKQEWERKSDNNQRIQPCPQKMCCNE
jgi:hypothetical protein